MSDTYEHKTEETVETKDRGLFDLLGRKNEEKKHDHDETAAISDEFEHKAHVSEHGHGYGHEPVAPVHHHVSDEHVAPVVKEEEVVVEEKKHESFLEKLKRSDSNSSSSSEEEVEEGGVKIKRKKLKEKIKQADHDTAVPVEKIDEPQEEKKGFLDKIKEKLPGKKSSEEIPAPPPPVAADYGTSTTTEVEAKDKKGILEKIKEKLPGYHPKTDEAEKEKEKEKDGGHY